MFVLSILIACIYVPHKMIVTGRSDGYALTTKDNRQIIKDKYTFIWDFDSENYNYNLGKLNTFIGEPNYVKMIHEFITISFLYGFLYLLISYYNKILHRLHKK